MPPTPANLEAALAYAERGWPVFPCNPRDKTPLLPRDKDPDTGKPIPKSGGVSKASTDAGMIRSWWMKWPKALVAIATGHPTINMGGRRLFVVDFDPRTDEATGEVWSLERLKAETEAQIGVQLPPSLTALTPSDGVHLYLLQDDDGAPVTNRGNLPFHVDVRGLGGYVIAPPSVMAPNAIKGQGGLRYRWHRREPMGGIARAPAQLLAVLREAKAPPPRPANADRPSELPERSRAPSEDPVELAREKWAQAAFANEIRAAEQLREGGRNDGISAAALRLGAIVGAGYLSQSQVRGALYAVAALWPDVSKTQGSIDSALTKGMATPRDMGDVGAAAGRAADQRGRPRPSGPAPAPPARRSGPIETHPSEPEGAEALSELEEGVRTRLKAVAAAWLLRRCQYVEREKDAIVRLAFSVGRRVAAGLLDENSAKERLWDVYGETVADVQHADIDRALGDGALRGFDLRPLLLTMKCSGYPMTDFGIGERFRDRFGADFRFTTAKGWLGWDKKRWKVLDQDEKSPPAEVVAAVMETVRAIQDEARFVADTGVRWGLVKEGKQERLDLEEGNPHGMDRWIPKGKSFELLSTKIAVFGRQSETAGKPSAIANLARRWLTLSIEEFDRDPLSINVLNGTLRFTREMLPDGSRSASVELERHRREDLNTKLAPVEYDSSALSPVYDGFLAWAHPDLATRRYLHQVVGYGFSGDTSEQKLWFHYGLGANGKSTAIDLWAHVAGDYSGSIGIETFLDQGIKKRGEQASPDLARLGGVRFLRASEPERGSKLNEALIKAATGGEPMPVRALHRGFFDLQPLFKLMISGNYKPDIPGTDEGIWRRMKLVPWNAHVEDADRDETLGAKLRAEAAGVLNHVVRGLLDWLTHGLIEPKAVSEATAQYREDSDPAGRFLTECTVTEAGAKTQSSKLHEVFVAWAKASGEREWSNKGLAQALSARGLIKKQSDGIWWLDLRLTKEAGDFVDGEGKVRDLGDGNFASPAKGSGAPPRPPPEADDGPIPGWE